MCLGEIAQVREVIADAVVVQTAGRTATASTILLDAVPQVGDWLVVHSGFALDTLTEAEARDALTLRAGEDPDPS